MTTCAVTPLQVRKFHARINAGQGGTRGYLFQLRSAIQSSASCLH